MTAKDFSLTNIKNTVGRVLLAVSFLFPCTSLSAATDSLSVGTLPDGTEVMAEKHFFGKRIERFDPVPGLPQLCLRFVEKVPPLRQELGLYDVSRHRMMWRTEVDFAKDYYLPTRQGIILRSEKTACLLDEKGSVRWEVKKFQPVYADDRSGVVFGYPSSTSNDLKALSLSEGKSLWTAVLPHKNGWGEVMPLEDGRLLISADWICLLNPLDGTMSTHDVDNAAQSLKAPLTSPSAGVVFGGIVGGLLGGLIFGYMPYIVAVPAVGYISHLNSNFCYEDGRIYYADRRYLRCLSDKMRVIWEKELPKKASMSNIRIKEDTLFFENTGWGKDAKGSFHGNSRAYSMRYNRWDGTELSEKEALAEGDNLVYCYLRKPGEPRFTPRRLNAEEMKKQEVAYQIARPLSQEHVIIFRDKDYWIVDRAGNVLMHFTKPILQVEVIGNELVGLTDNNVIFQLGVNIQKERFGNP